MSSQSQVNLCLEKVKVLCDFDQWIIFIVKESGGKVVLYRVIHTSTSLNFVNVS